MVVDAVRTYLDAANGLTELTRRQAVAAAKSLLRAEGRTISAGDGADGPPPRVGQNIQALAGELIETSQANREAVTDLVRAEVGRALEQMDMVPRAEYERVVRRVAELERRMAARHVVERVPVPHGGVSSALPLSGEKPGESPRQGSEPVEAEPDGAERVPQGEIAETQAAETQSVESEDVESEADENVIGSADTEGSGTGGDPEAQATDGEVEESGSETAGAKQTATRTKAKPGTKGARPRSATKRKSAKK